MARIWKTGAALGVVMGLWVFEAQAEEGLPGSDLAVAMGQYLDLRQSVVLGGSEAEAARLDRAAAGVAVACGGKLPEDCLFAEALTLAATAEEPEEKPLGAGWLTRSEAQRKIVVYLTLADEVDAARELVDSIDDGSERMVAERVLLGVLIDEGFLETATESLVYRENADVIARGASDRVEELIDAGEREAALEALPRAEKLAGMVDVKFLRVQSMLRVVWLYLDLGEFDAAKTLRQQIDDDFGQASLSAHTALTLAEGGSFAAAEVEADSIDAKERERDEAFESIAVELAKVGQLAEARRVVGRIEGPVEKSRALGAVAAALSEVKGQGVAEMFAEAKALAEGIDDAVDRVEALGEVAEAFVRAGDTSAAQALAVELTAMETYPKEVFWALEGIAKTFRDVGSRDASIRCALQAEGLAMRIADPVHRSRAHFYLARLLIDLGAYPEAERVGMKIGEWDYQFFALKNLGVALSKSGNAEKDVRRISALILWVAEVRGWRRGGLKEVAKALAIFGDFSGAEDVANGIVEPDWRAQALAAVAEALAATHPSDAVRIGRRVEDPGWRSVVLAAVAAGL